MFRKSKVWSAEYSGGAKLGEQNGQEEPNDATKTISRSQMRREKLSRGAK